MLKSTDLDTALYLVYGACALAYTPHGKSMNNLQGQANVDCTRRVRRDVMLNHQTGWIAYSGQLHRHQWRQVGMNGNGPVPRQSGSSDDAVLASDVVRALLFRRGEQTHREKKDRVRFVVSIIVR
ncbi:hypothetical protein VFPPC_17808 [Pochonia chlamydosporia 170]|uniref:Uncharacterized protein n=1 Tax=Pochonia chlamydosporia 170 TaxID=1380566 RepID=A0A219AQX2_METCM|nr:hypothetical protein VFPPC_17808 [Pochonia chlamydosporia 170]OWT42999.1 hypothetical protein VFPPC_17808 [Pochonia chlamydosporia 170]